ncbi:MAG TPA: NfeD family protein [Bacteroidales bacterium]|nr:NfeD family protein [Bacteroidales bacterium]HNS47850.1 NfeD family protein [Bacteroidales bacterium]
MTWTLIVILLLVGFVLLLLEMLVIPGITVAAVLGFVSIALAVWGAFASYGTTAGFITLTTGILGSVVLLIVALKAKTWNRFALKSSIDGKVNVIGEAAVRSGDTGKTVSRLAPSGKALINGEYYEVHTIGEFIDPGSEIVVTKVDFNQITVKPKNT